MSSSLRKWNREYVYTIQEPEKYKVNAKSQA